MCGSFNPSKIDRKKRDSDESSEYQSDQSESEEEEEADSDEDDDFDDEEKSDDGAVVKRVRRGGRYKLRGGCSESEEGKEEFVGV